MFILVFIILIALAAAARAEETYTFDPTETEKKPYHFGGYVEFKPILSGLDHNAAFYKLRFYNAGQGNTLMEWDGKVQLEGSYEKGIFRLYANTNTDLESTYAGNSERSLFYEAYGSMKPSSSLKIDVGKKAMKWGKGYAWRPVAFLDRQKDPDDPELAQKGYIVTSVDYIKSFDGPLKTISFTPVLLPVCNHINDESWQTDNLNVAGRLYLLLYDTDIDFVFLARGSKTDRFGVDFSRNITTNFEIHGEFAYIRDHQKTVLDAVPPDIDYVEVRNDLLAIPSVEEVNDLHIWQTGAAQKLLSAHIRITDKTSDSEAIIRTAQEMLLHKYGINHTTLQILPGSAGEMEHCNHCN